MKNSKSTTRKFKAHNIGLLLVLVVIGTSLIFLTGISNNTKPTMEEKVTKYLKEVHHAIPRSSEKQVFFLMPVNSCKNSSVRMISYYNQKKNRLNLKTIIISQGKYSLLANDWFSEIVADHYDFGFKCESYGLFWDVPKVAFSNNGKIENIYDFHCKVENKLTAQIESFLED